MKIIDQYQSIDAQGRRRFWAAFTRLPTRTAEEELRSWCKATFGKSGDLEHGAWHDRIQYGEISFARESNLALFVMRWS